MEGSMRRLPLLFFAAAIAIWGLASIPDGSSGEKSLQVSGARTAAAYRRGQLAGNPRDAFTSRKATISSLRAARLDHCGAPAGTREPVRPTPVCSSAGDLGGDL
jgi:hypothetical protein